MSTPLHPGVTCVWGNIPIGLGMWIVASKLAIEVCQTCGECLNHIHYIHHIRISILTSWLSNSPIPLVIFWSPWPLIPRIIQCSQLMTIRSGVSLKSTMMAYMVCSRTSLWFWRWSPFGFRPDHWLVARRGLFNILWSATFFSFSTFVFSIVRATTTGSLAFTNFTSLEIFTAELLSSVYSNSVLSEKGFWWERTLKVQIVHKTLWMFRPPITKLPIQALWQTISVQNMNKLNTKLINNLNQIKSHP